MKTNRIYCVLSFLMLLWFVNTVNGLAQHQRLSFAEVTQRADLIFVGTVTRQASRINEQQTMIFTEVSFTDVEVVHAGEHARQKSGSGITLQYDGGQVGDWGVHVSETPVLALGKRYLLFVKDDGRKYVTPLVGGPQGQFEVLRDEITGQEYVLNAAGKAVVGLTESQLKLSAQRVASIRRGRLRQASGDVAAESPVSLSTLLAHIVNTSLNVPVKSPAASPRPDNAPAEMRGGFGRLVNGEVVIEPLAVNEIKPITLAERFAPALPFGPYRTPNPVAGAAADAFDWLRPPDALKNLPGSVNHSRSISGGGISFCGYQNLPVVMEQTLSSHQTYDINDESMFTWNLFLDVYRVRESDGTFGSRNSQSEFTGFLTGATRQAVYGSMWSDTTVGIAFSYFRGDQCALIDETDLALNGELFWTNDPALARLFPSFLLIRPVIMHEVGHVWGSMRGLPGGETYDYDVPSVMQGYVSDYVIEDGWGIHAPDSYLFRLDYINDRSPSQLRDVGVESYYALNGLNNSTTDTDTYRPGQAMTLSNVTVENISVWTVNNLRVRFFLSLDRNLSESDYELTSSQPSLWPSFSGETYIVNNFTKQIPSNVVPNQYFVLANVSFDGVDGFPLNNTTSFFGQVSVTCAGSYSVFPNTLGMLATGGTAEFNITAPSACSWSFESVPSWIQRIEPFGTLGDGKFRFQVAANLGPARSATFNLAGREVTFTQLAGCLAQSTTPISFDALPFSLLFTDELSATSCLSQTRSLGQFKPLAKSYIFNGKVGQQIAISSAAVPGAIFVNKLEPFLTLIDPTSKNLAQSQTSFTGKGARIPFAGWLTLGTTGSYIVEVSSSDVENPTGRYSLDLEECLFSVSRPRVLTFTKNGGNGTFGVTCQGGCQWSASSNQSWLGFIPDRGIGTVGSLKREGSGKVTFIVSPNKTFINRQFSVSIAGQTFLVRQTG